MLSDQLLNAASAPVWRLQGGFGPSEESETRAGAPGAAGVAAGELLKVVYLGISGVLHPSASLYKFIHGRSPWNDGHSEYESVPVLEAALAGWPEAQIVLTSTQPWAKGLEPVLERLGPGLAGRVIACTYEDLTGRVRVGERQLPFSADGYWRLMKSEIVRYHREWLRPSGWIAIDDETVFWSVKEWRNHVVATDGCLGLLEPRAQDRLMTLLLGNFGPSNVAVHK